MNSKLLYNFAMGVSLLMIGHSVFAQRVSSLKAGYFLRMCKDTKNLNSCDAYINGIADGVSYSKIYANHQGNKTTPVGFCIAPATKGTEMRQKIVSWMQVHKEQLNQPVGSVVFTALHESYPCKMITDGNR